MSYLHELKGTVDKLVVNSDGQYVVLGAVGAVFQNFFTDDPLNMCIAFGRLFDGDWRQATDEEYWEWMGKAPSRQILALAWTDPPPREPRLKLIPDSGPGE